MRSGLLAIFLSWQSVSSLQPVVFLPPQQEPVVWPPPQRFLYSGPPRPLHSDFQIWAAQKTDILEEAVKRYTDILAPMVAFRKKFSPVDPLQSQSLKSLRIEVVYPQDESLNMHTDYSYTLVLREGAPFGIVRASSVYGALYALETFSQLVDANGILTSSSVSVDDEPQYAWRGLLIDTGRRFFPVSLVKNLMDTMVAVKLNVLHLHASDNCRFAVESKLYPAATSALVGEFAGFYTQADIEDLISYGKKRGIRIVPEFDIPGHTRGLMSLKEAGLKFCSEVNPVTGAPQLYNDAANSTLSILEKLLGEMATLFDDDVFHLGCDETEVAAECSRESTFELERHLIKTLHNQHSKTVEAWQEVLLAADVETQNIVVNRWRSHADSSITSTGRRVVDSSHNNFYLGTVSPGGPDGWSRFHHDIGAGVAGTERSLLLGGEVSAWTDEYCITSQCDTKSTVPPPAGSQLFSPSSDRAFSQSIGGLIWPRGYVAAGSFWNFDGSADPASLSFQNSMWKLNDRLKARGSFVCPSRCDCDLLTACGRPYLPSAGNELNYE